MDLAAEIPENSRIEKIQKFMKADIRKGLFIMMADKAIDQGRPFDWGKVSEDYARFRDIYPKEFYERIVERNLCVKGQRVLDLGTGTGVLPRNMYQYGAKSKRLCLNFTVYWTERDVSLSSIWPGCLLKIKLQGQVKNWC